MYEALKWSKTMQDGASTGTYFQLFPNAKRDPILERENAEADDFQRERYWLALNSKAPSQWLSDHLQESQRLTGAVYVAIKVLSDQASTADVNFFEWEHDARLGQDKDAKKPLPRSHPLCKLIHRPNKWDSKGMLLRRIVQQLCLTGSSLCWRVDDGNDMPRELWSIPTGAYQPVPISSKYPDGAYSIQTWFPGPLAYIPGITNPGGAIVSANNILVTRYPHPLVINEGNSPLNACALSLDTLESIDRARMTKMRRGIYPSAIATLDGNSKMPEKNELLRLRTQINQAIGGPDKCGLPAVLAPGMKLEQYGSDKIEVGWVESWNQLCSFVLSIFGVTKSLAFMSEETSYAALYASLMQFSLGTMTPLLTLISDAVNHQLVEPFYGEDYCLEFVPKPVHDEQMKETAYLNDYQVGLRTIDEMRVARGLGKAPFPGGDERALRGQVRISEDASSEPNSPAPSENETMKNSRPENSLGGGSRGENKMNGHHARLDKELWGMIRNLQEGN